MSQKISYDFSLIVLETQLRKEERDLLMYNQYIDTAFGQTNVKCCKEKIKDLKNTIELIKTKIK